MPKDVMHRYFEMFSKLLDAISSALEDNESLYRLTTFVILTKVNLSKFMMRLMREVGTSR